MFSFSILNYHISKPSVFARTVAELALGSLVCGGAGVGLSRFASKLASDMHCLLCLVYLNISSGRYAALFIAPAEGCGLWPPQGGLWPPGRALQALPALFCNHNGHIWEGQFS